MLDIVCSEPWIEPPSLTFPFTRKGPGLAPSRSTVENWKGYVDACAHEIQLVDSLREIIGLIL